MADEANVSAEESPKKKKGGLLIGLVLALAGGGGAFAYTSGMLGGGTDGAPNTKLATFGDDLAFIPVDPLTVALSDSSQRSFLRFRAELEVAAAYKADIKRLMPRVVDVLNTYLQSLSLKDIEDPSSLLTLRSQMRRRVDLVVGGDRVHDLLVMEFVVN